MDSALSTGRLRAFTLIEVAIAVALVGLAFTTLIGLQTRHADAYQQERSLTRAALLAQYYLTMIEVSSRLPAEGRDERDLAEALREKGYFDDAGGESWKAEEEELKSWKLIAQVEKISLLDVEDVLRRIDLSIRWGEGPTESYSLVYFIRGAVSRSRAGDS